MSAPNIRPLGFGEILDGAFTLYRRNFATFLVTALVPTAVMAAVFLVFGGAYLTAMVSGDPTALLAAMPTFFVGMLVGGLVYVAMWGALTHDSAEAYLGRPVSVADGMRTGGRKLLPILLTTVVSGIAVGVAYLAAALLFVLITMLGALSGLAAVAVVFGLIGGVVAAAVFLVAMASLFAVVPAVMVENKGPIEAISRSMDLVRGARGRVVGLLVVALLITYLPMFAVMFVTGGFAQIADPSNMPSTGQMMTQQLLGLGTSVLTTPFLVSVIVLLYFDRRVRTEALDVQMAADRLAVAGG